MTLQTQIRTLKRLVRRVHPVDVPQPRWREILGDDWEEWQRLAAAPGGQRVLLAPSNGHPAATTLDSLLAVALTLRGARVDVLTCDEALPACQTSANLGAQPEWVQNEFLRHGPRRDLCPSCYRPSRAMFNELGLKVLQYSAFLTPADREHAEALSAAIPLDEIAGYVDEGVPVGEHARAGAIRFFASSAIEQEQHGEAVLRRYFHSSLLTRAGVGRLLEDGGYSCASFHHGIYVPQGIVGGVSRHTGVRVVNWCQAYRKNSFIFSHGDTYHHTLMTEPVSAWEDLPWDSGREQELVDYLQSRWSGARDWISFNRDPQNDLREISQETGIDFSKPLVGLLTNVVWDAQLHYPQNAFEDMLAWLRTTVAYFVSRPDLQLVIRVHPAEATGQIRSRQPVEAEIRREFPDLPPNVFIVGAQSKISTYAIAMQCDAVLIYGTKTGVELTSFGIPVVVAGEAWIRNKGITTDATSVDDYLATLATLPWGRRLDDETTTRARKYAYHFFFRRMIPLQVVEPHESSGWCPYRVAIRGLDDLRPGRDPGLDTICDGILKGDPFVFPAERQDGRASIAPQARKTA